MEIEVRHVKGMQFVANIRQHSVMIDISPSEGGFDEGPRPTELLIAALGACMGVYSGKFCQKHNLPFEGMGVKLSWDRAESPTRLENIKAEISLPKPGRADGPGPALPGAEHSEERPRGEDRVRLESPAVRRRYV
jgi:putative redox protein